MIDGPTDAYGRHDFDFFFGEWTVDSRRLAARLAGSTAWDRVPGHCRVRPILDGVGNTDEIGFPARKFTGATLRLFDRRTGDWSLYWASDRDGVLLPPVTGRFEAGVGVFYGDDVEGGRPVRVRYVWSNITERTARWEQAFSIDQGRTWETNWTMDMTRVGAPPRGAAPRDDWPLIELRRYAMKPGRRDDLIALFERELIDPQEACGMRVIGQFTSDGDPAEFAWLRGFADMDARRAALERFYDGPAWAAHGPAANETMLDWSNVRLLRPARPASGFRLGSSRSGAAPDLVLATIYPLAAPAGLALLDLFEREIAPALRAAGASLLGTFVSEPSPNTFPRLPVREHEPVLVWMASFADPSARASFESTLRRDESWSTILRPALERFLAGRDETIVLRRAGPSLLRHRSCGGRRT